MTEQSLTVSYWNGNVSGGLIGKVDGADRNEGAKIQPGARWKFLHTFFV